MAAEHDDLDEFDISEAEFDARMAAAEPAELIARPADASSDVFRDALVAMVQHGRMSPAELSKRMSLDIKVAEAIIEALPNLDSTIFDNHVNQLQGVRLEDLNSPTTIRH